MSKKTFLLILAGVIPVSISLLFISFPLRAGGEAPPAESNAESAPDEEQALEESIAKLIEQLGSEKYEERVAAKKELEEIGERAKEALKAASKHYDPEIAASAKELLDKLGKLNITFVFIDCEGAPLKGANARISGNAKGPDAKSAYKRVDLKKGIPDDGRVAIPQIEAYSICHFFFEIDGCETGYLQNTRYQYGSVVVYVNCIKYGGVSGVLLDADNNDAPLADCDISIGSKSAKTDRDGRFTIGGIKPGWATVSIRGSKGKSYIAAPGSALVLVRPGKTTDAVIKATASRFSSGKVAGVALDPDGKPLANTLIYVSSKSAEIRTLNYFLPQPNRRGLWQMPRILATDESGRFACEYSSAAKIILRVKAVGYAAMSEAQTVELKPGETVEFQEPFRMADGARLTVKVFDKDGNPIEDAAVIINRSDAPGVNSDIGSILPKRGIVADLTGGGETVSPDEHAHSTGDTGVATVRGLAPGKYNIMAVGYFHAPGKMTTLEIKKGEKASELELRLQDYGEATIKVVDAKTNKPLEKANAWVDSDDACLPLLPGSINLAPCRSLFTGSYAYPFAVYEGEALIDNLAPGVRKIVVSADNYRSRCVTVEIKSGENAETTVALEPLPPVKEPVKEPGTGAVSGRIRASKTTPLSEVGCVILNGISYPNVSQEPVFFTLGKYGSFGTECLTGSRELLVRSRTGELLGRHRVDITEGKTAEIVITLPEMGSISGRIVDGEGKPCAKISLYISVSPSNKNFPWLTGITVMTDAEGKFRAENIIEGDYTIVMSRSGLYGIYDRIGSKEVWPAAVKGGEETKLELALEATTTLNGAVKGPWKNGVVIAILPKGDPARLILSHNYIIARSDEDGKFFVEGIIPGEYQLAALSPMTNCGVLKEIKVEKGKPPEEVEIEMPGNLQKVRGMVKGFTPPMYCSYPLSEMVVAIGPYWSVGWIKADGSFEFYAPPGKYRLCLSSREITPESAEKRSVEIEVQEGRDLEGVEIPST